MSDGLLVHEWLSVTGGSENVLEKLASYFPDAPITCLWDDKPGRFAPGRVTETWLARSPLRKSKALALPFMAPTWRHLPERQADWILCSSHLFSHHAQFGGSAKHAPKYVYAHTPARYIWEPDLDARAGGFLTSRVASGYRSLDRRRAGEAVSIAANSRFVQDRIRRAWDRESIVIHPPVEVSEFVKDTSEHLSVQEQDVVRRLPPTFLLGASRFVPYKRLDAVIRAGAAAGVPVVLAGAGPDEARLRALAEQSDHQVTFVLDPSRHMLVHLFRLASVYIFPPIEDFGIMPVEAMATGTPVVANAVGGAAESIVQGVTGALLHEFSDSAIKEAVEVAAGCAPQACIDRAWEFDAAKFELAIRAWLPQ